MFFHCFWWFLFFLFSFCVSLRLGPSNLINSLKLKQSLKKLVAYKRHSVEPYRCSLFYRQTSRVVQNLPLRRNTSLEGFLDLRGYLKNCRAHHAVWFKWLYFDALATQTHILHRETLFVLFFSSGKFFIFTADFTSLDSTEK
jgi:hypothetical protein